MEFQALGTLGLICCYILRLCKVEFPPLFCPFCGKEAVSFVGLNLFEHYGTCSFSSSFFPFLDSSKVLYS
ncbi:hypothetical protein Peur_018854 [Populus x canadensis]